MLRSTNSYAHAFFFILHQALHRIGTIVLIVFLIVAVCGVMEKRIIKYWQRRRLFGLDDATDGLIQYDMDRFASNLSMGGMGGGAGMTSGGGVNLNAPMAGSPDSARYNITYASGTDLNASAE